MDIVNRYRDTRVSSSDDDHEDDECPVWETAEKPFTDEEPGILPNEKKDIAEPQQVSEELKPNSGEKRKRNTIWSDVLQDQLISEDLEDCLLNKPRKYVNRGKESYDYNYAYIKKKRGTDCELSEGYKSSFKKSSKKFVKLSSTELQAARKINKVIQEKKFFLIQRVVKYAGIDKAIQLLEKTKQIEDDGGMMTKNQKRRRTPGGVYIQLLKSDKDVTQEVLDKIFEGETSVKEMKKRFEEKKKKGKYKKVSKPYFNKKDSNPNKKKTSKHFKGNFKKKMSFEPMEMQPIDNQDNINEEPEVIDPDTHVMQIVDDENSTKGKPGFINPNTDLISVPVIDNESSEIVSDLEEGEIRE